MQHQSSFQVSISDFPFISMAFDLTNMMSRLFKNKFVDSNSYCQFYRIENIYQVKDIYSDNIFSSINKNYLPNLRDEILTITSYSPRDFEKKPSTCIHMWYTRLWSRFTLSKWPNETNAGIIRFKNTINIKCIFVQFWKASWAWCIYGTRPKCCNDYIS